MKSIRMPALLVMAAWVIPAGMPAVAAESCNRGCLLTLADDYLAALEARDASRVPFASDVRFVEQARRIKPGEGLWQGISGAVNQDFKLLVADAEAQQVAGIVMLESEGRPAQLGFRLKLVDGRITEAEHLVAHSRPEMMGNLTKLRPQLLMEVPYDYADSRGRLIGIAKSYYPALDWNNGSLSPFAPDCERRENGMRTAPNGGVAGGAGMPGAAPRPPSLRGMHDCKSQIDSQNFGYIDTIDNVRVEIADEKLGLAVGFSQFRHSMTRNEFPVLNDPERKTMTVDFAPFDLPAMHIYKIWGGLIHEIEAIGFQAPYNSPSGWE